MRASNKIHFIFMVLFAGIFSLAISVSAQAQQEQEYRVETEDDNVFVGVMISENDEEIVLNTDDYGEITISKQRIRKMEKRDPAEDEKMFYDYENPQYTRYLFAPNAIGLKKGNGYYQNTWILFNNVNYGLADNFSLGGGMVPLFLFGSVETPIWLLPKVSVPVADERVHLAAGAMIGGVVGENSSAGGVFYGASTFGNTDQNLTLGVGYGYSGGDISNTPVFNISGMTRLGNTTYLISENYLFPEADINGLTSLGVRWAPENFAVDFALVRPLGNTGSFIGIPWLGVSIPFGDR